MISREILLLLYKRSFFKGKLPLNAREGVALDHIYVQNVTRER